MITNTLPKDNTFLSVRILLKHLEVRTSTTNLKDKLYNHPEYPSLDSVIDVFQSLNVSSLAINISSQELPEVPTPCLAALNTEGGTFAVIHEVSEGFVEWQHTEKGKQRETIESFAEKWEGVLLLAQADETSGEVDYQKNRRQEILSLVGSYLLLIGIISVFIATVFFFVNQSGSFSASFFFVLIVKFMGVAISSLLLWYLLDKQNPFLKNICQVGKSTNCNSVLNSKVATIGGILSWSEIGFFYFMGSFLALLFGLDSTNTICVLTCLNLSALPYTFFSVYYQGVVVKKWCILCLSVQILLWLEFIAFIFYRGKIKFPVLPSLKESLLLFIAFALPVIVWFVLKPIFQSALQTHSLNLRLRQFQNNPTIFKQLLSDEAQMFSILPNMPIIEIGNSEAQNVITLATNPYCSTCAEAHKTIQKLIAENEETLKCQVVFTVSNDLKDIRNEFVRHLFSLKETEQVKALDFWFEMEEKDFKTWANRFPIDDIDKSVTETIKMHNFWCSKSMIRATPTFFINDHLLPDVYQIEDISRIASRIFT